MRFAVVILLAALLTQCNGADIYKLTCTMKPAADADAGGTVELTQPGGPGTPVTFSGSITNIPTGLHAFHIHTYGDATASNGKGMGGHWNPAGVAHSCYPATPRHAGDIGVLDFTTSTFTFPGGYTRDLVELSGLDSVVGRGLVLHELNDTCTGASGNAGARLAQCTLGIATPGADTQRAFYSTRNETWAVASITQVSSATTAVSGSVWFALLPSGLVRVYVRLTSDFVADGMHGIHVHEWGDISDADAGNVGGHYNPAGVDHALPLGVRHQGDMGNVNVTGATGEFVATKNLDLLNMGSSMTNIIGRAVILHSGPDDGGQPTGNAGSKLALGAIGLSNGPPAKVVAIIKGTTNAPDASGTIFIDQPYGPGTDVTITGTLANFPAGQHAIHVHEYGNPTADDGTSAGGHYNPDNREHGCYPSDLRHAGDIGTITVAADGTYTFAASFTRDLIDLSGPRSVVGRALVIHAAADSCTGASGDAGARLAVGVLGIASVPAVGMNMAYQGITSSPGVFRGVAVLQSVTSPANDAFRATFYFHERSDGLAIHGLVYGLPANTVHGLHVHEWGDLTDATGANVGSHYNPAGVTHGLPSESPNHLGDLGNFLVYTDGVAYVNLVITGSNKPLAGFDSIIGRALVIHSGKDNGAEAQPTGAAGSKVASGVIGICSINCWPSAILQQPVDEGESIHPLTWVILAACILLVCVVLAVVVVIWRRKSAANSGDNKLDFI